MCRGQVRGIVKRDGGIVLAGGLEGKLLLGCVLNFRLFKAVQEGFYGLCRSLAQLYYVDMRNRIAPVRTSVDHRLGGRHWRL